MLLWKVTQIMTAYIFKNKFAKCLYGFR